MEDNLDEAVKTNVFGTQNVADMAERAVLIQEYVSGTEYGVDVINDLNGKYVTTFVKMKLSMRGGETDKAVTVDFPEVEH